MSALRELADSRELLVNLTMREVRGKYKRTALGQGWSLLNPLASIAIFSLVFGFLLKAGPPKGDPSGLDYFGLWLACGLLPWAFFSSAVLAGTHALILNANLVKKVYFPRELLIASTVAASAVTLMTELVVLVVLLVAFGGGPLLWLPGVLLAVLLLAAFALGLALALAIANVYFRDVSHLLALVFQFWFYLTPVVYSSDLVDRAVAARGGVFLLGQEVPVSLLYGLNPMERFVSVFRSLLYDNRWPAWQDWTGAALSAVVALVVGVALFHRFGGRVVEEL